MPLSFFLYWWWYCIMKKHRIYIKTRAVQLLASWSCCIPVWPVCNVFYFHGPYPFLSFFSFCKCQNYFKDGWNIFDCVTVLGSITDILVTELGVSKKTQKRQRWKHDILSMAEGTLAHVWGPLHLCHCLKTDWKHDNDVRENSLAAFESFTAQSCTNGSWKSYINVPVGETRRHQSQAGQHWAKDSEAEGRGSAAVNQCTTSASLPWQPVKSLSSSACCQ